MKTFSEVKDSGVREEFSTGSRRDTQDGKGRFDLISPIALQRLAIHYQNGANKYGDRNWEKGQPLSRYISSALGHINKFMLGLDDEDHLSAAAWNIFCVIHTEEMVVQGKLPLELVDLPHRVQVKMIHEDIMDPTNTFKIDQRVLSTKVEFAGSKSKLRWNPAEHIDDDLPL